jgi:outer membrane lipoprotein LolB
MLAACAPMQVKTHAPNAADEAAQQAREAALSGRTHWSLAAHIGVSNGRDSGSGELDWHQDGDKYTFTVRAPVTGKTWKLSGDAGHARLEGVESTPIEGDDAEVLLHNRVGWDVPLAALRAWVLGLRAPVASGRVSYADSGLLAQIDQSGWSVEYRDWFTERNPPLPRRVFASRGTTRVKMAIESWELE